MLTVTVSPELRKYLAARGLTLDSLEERPEQGESFEPSAEDLADYVAWRAETEAREQDEEDARRHCEWVEAHEADYRD